jgi:hypothetical protein
MLPKIDDLTLQQLVELKENAERLIEIRREEGADEFRKNAERAAAELGVSLPKLLRGANGRRRRATKEQAEDEA